MMILMTKRMRWTHVFFLVVTAAVLSGFSLVAQATEATNTTTTSTTSSNDSSSGGNDGVKDLFIMGLFPFTGTWHGGESLLAAVNVTINHINRMNALPGYRLNLVNNDTRCDPGYGVKMLFEQLYSPPTKLLILGAACSSVTEALARTSHHWNLVQISCVSSSPALSNKALFPLFGRVNAPLSTLNPARTKFVSQFGWSRIATIHETQEVFSKTMDDLVQMMKAEGITVVRSEMFRDDPSMQVRNLLKHDCRIIIGAFYENMARKVLCEAYKIGLYGRRIVWIMPGYFEERWWAVEDPLTDCTASQITEAAEGYFDLDFVRFSPHSDRTVSGWLPSDYLREYNNAVNNESLYGEQLAPHGFDAIWAVTLALNMTRQRLLDMGSSKRLEDFTYADKELAQLIYSNFLNLSFVGIRGPISFDSNGDVVSLVKLSRTVDGVRKITGYFDLTKSDDTAFEWSKDSPIVWKGGVPPRDSTVTRVEYLTLSVALYASTCVLAVLGILLAGVFLAFNILLRNVKIVKMSSPRMNNAILVGCICAYSSVIIQDAGGAHGVLGCEVKTALLVIGLSLAFGALFAKTWRVHVIFTNTKMKRKILSDGHLFAMLGVLLMINMVVLITWWIVDPREVKVTSVITSLEEDKAGEIVVQQKELSCVSQNQLYFLGTLYGIHALVLLLGTFLAYETRNVHYPELNDSKYIGMSIYNVAVLSIPAVVLGVALNPTLNLKYALTSGLVLLGTTITQCIIFVPKVVSYRHHRVHGTLDQPTTMKGTLRTDNPGLPRTETSMAPPSVQPGQSADAF